MGDPFGLGAIAVLLTALGLSSVAGLRAYFPLLAVAVGSNIPVAGGGDLVPLSKPFHALGTWWFVSLLVVLVLAEFTVDKIPVLDHISDALHTIVRPISGAIIVAGTSNPLSEHNMWAAAVVGAVLALSVHVVKAASRPAVTAVTAGIGNPVVSGVEDVLATFIALLAVLAPVLAPIAIIALAFGVGMLIHKGWQRVRAQRQTASAFSSGSPPTLA